MALLPLFATFTYTLAQAPDITDEGCFLSSSGLTNGGSQQYQTNDLCQKQCIGQGKAVMATHKGTDCWCGDKLPPVNSKQTDSSSCNTPCAGYGIGPLKCKSASIP